MFIESVQYSLQSVKIIVKNLKEERNSLPITVTKDNRKCLDFDLDNIVFKSAPKSPVKITPINPCNKSWLEVMDMV
jgi:hypothetical protein